MFKRSWPRLRTETIPWCRPLPGTTPPRGAFALLRHSVRKWTRSDSPWAPTRLAPSGPCVRKEQVSSTTRTQPAVLDHDRFGTPPRDLAGPIDKIVVSDRDRAPSQPRCPTTGMRRQTGLCRQGNRDLRWPLDQANVGTVSRYRQRGVPWPVSSTPFGSSKARWASSQRCAKNIRNCISMSMGHQRPGLCRAIRRSAVSRK